MESEFRQGNTGFVDKDIQVVLKIKEYLRFIMRACMVLPSIAVLLVVAVSVRGEDQNFLNNKSGEIALEK